MKNLPYLGVMFIAMYCTFLMGENSALRSQKNVEVRIVQVDPEAPEAILTEPKKKEKEQSQESNLPKPDLKHNEMQIFVRALVQQESGGDYSVVNKRTGAMGRYQIMPQNLTGWGKYSGKKNFGWDYDALGYDITPAQFLASSELQDKIFFHRIQKIYKVNLQRAKGNQSQAMIYTAREWYSGTWKPSDRKPACGEPSPNQYAEQILMKMENGGLSS